MLYDYCYFFGKKVAIALGFGSLYNHSKKPNAEWEIKKSSHTIVFRAIKNIRKGKEITIDYGIPLWFKAS